MSLQITSFFKQNALPKSVVGIAALSLIAGSSSVAVAQDATDEDDVEYEWEPGTGKHVEEWYDPSDWFNQDDVTDYEELNDYGYDGYMGTAGDFNYDAYYDGYYDGYYDDSFGYDYWDATWEPEYATYYTSGYYDGYYDSQQDYDFDAYYYVYGQDTSPDGEAADRQRAADQTRERGDRQKSKSSSKDSQQSDKSISMDKANDLMAVRARIRGVVTDIVLTGTEEVHDKRHTTGRLGFANGTEIMVDFGPYVNEKNLSIDRGDIITVVGKWIERDDQQMLRASRLTDGGITYMFAGPKRDVLKKDMKDGKKTYDDWSTRDGDKSKDKDKSGGRSGN